MDISVIVVTYNQEQTIARTLDSILAQRFSGSYEIVIGDDCSTDGTGHICREYAARYPDRIRYIRRESNMGVCENYFACIADAKGKYLADCAGDDYWVDTDKLQREFDVIEADPGISMVVTDWLCEDSETGRHFRTKINPEVTALKVWLKGELLMPLFLQKVTLHLCTALYRRDPIVRYVAKNPELLVSDTFVCEDLQILLICSHSGKIVLLPGVSLHYTVGHDSISHSADFAKRSVTAAYGLLQTLVNSIYFYVTDGPEFKKIIRGSVHRQAYAWAYVFRGRSQEGRKILREYETEGRYLGNLKCHVYRLLTKNRWIWKHASALRNALPERRKKDSLH